MFERFTDRARRVLVLAQEESRLLGHGFLGTEHILLGLIHEGDGVGAHALSQLGVTLEGVRDKVEEKIGPSGQAVAPTGSPPFTPRAKKVLELALREALQLGHSYMGTEHILLGIVREGEGVASQILAELGADGVRVRQTVMALLPQAGAATARPPVEFGRRAGRAATGFAARVLPGPESPTAVCSFCGRDLWEAGRYVVAQFAAICEECIATASSVLETAEVDQTGATDFPPRLYGRAPDGDAVEQVVAALQSTFASPSPELPQCEDAEELAPLLRQLSRDRSRRLLVTRVRFLDSDRAEVAFSPAWGPGVAHAGSAIRTDGVWYVTRATVISTLRSAGIVVPPPPSAPAGPEP